MHRRVRCCSVNKLARDLRERGEEGGEKGRIDSCCCTHTHYVRAREGDSMTTYDSWCIAGCISCPARLDSARLGSAYGTRFCLRPPPTTQIHSHRRAVHSPPKGGPGLGCSGVYGRRGGRKEIEHGRTSDSSSINSIYSSHVRRLSGGEGGGRGGDENAIIERWCACGACIVDVPGSRVGRGGGLRERD